MIKTGRMQTLKVSSEDASGFYLLCEENDEVFLPGALAPVDLSIGDSLEVFIYADKNGSQLATPQTPFAEVDSFACLRVKEVTKFGAFLDLGIPKDLFIPNMLQKYPMEVGNLHLVRVLLDKSNGQLLASEELEDYVDDDHRKLKPRQIVTLLPYHQTPLGFKVLIDDRYLGMIYHNQTFDEVVIGKKYAGTIKEINAAGQINALLQKQGLVGLEDYSEKIIKILQKHGGSIKVSDKSSPEEIKNKLNMSKKSFKRALGILYKKNLVEIEEDKITLTLS